MREPATFDYLKQYGVFTNRMTLSRAMQRQGFRVRAADIRQYQAQGAQAQRITAQECADQLRDDLEPLVKQGLSLRAIAALLTANEMRTPRGRAWGWSHG
jgi:hypothetical protein